MMKIPIPFTDSEKSLILENVIDSCIDPMKFKLAESRGQGILVNFDRDEFEDLTDAVAAASNHAENKKVQKQLDHLCDKLEGLLDSAFD